MTLYYNPSCELALQADSLSYTPRPLLSRMERELACLPMLLAGPGDTVVAAPPDDELLQLWFPNGGAPTFSLSPIPYPLSPKIAPWGWSRAVCHQFGLELEARSWRGRDLLSRRPSVDLERHLMTLAEGSDLPLLTAQPAVVTTTEEYRQYTAGLPEVVVKSLWSASGRGVRFYRLPRDQAEALRHVERTLTADGALVVERKLQRVAELSFLYQYATASSAGLRSLGASHFASAEMGAFGLELCGAGALDSVDALLPHGCRQRVQELLLTALNAVVTPRLGELPGCCFPLPLGVDAMVARTDNGVALRPTMELNLRRTMGLLSLGVERRLSPGVAATWTARHFETPGQWAQYAKEQQRTNPLQLDGEGRIRQGFFRLTPAGADQLFGGYGWGKFKL